MKCPTCSSEVKVVGNTTLHYEPVEVDVRVRELLQKIESMEKEHERVLVEELERLRKTYVDEKSRHSGIYSEFHRIIDLRINQLRRGK